MPKIHKASLINFQPNCLEHQKALDKCKYYEYFSNTDLFIKVLEDINFDIVEDVEPDDFKKYVIEDKIFIGLDTTEYISLDDKHYLFDAFNVYFALNDCEHYRLNKTLTKAWRTALVNEYPNSTYHLAVKKLTNKELDEMIEQFKQDNAELL